MVAADQGVRTAATSQLLGTWLPSAISLGPVGVPIFWDHFPGRFLGRGAGPTTVVGPVLRSTFWAVFRSPFGAAFSSDFGKRPGHFLLLASPGCNRRRGRAQLHGWAAERRRSILGLNLAPGTVGGHGDGRPVLPVAAGRKRQGRAHARGNADRAGPEQRHPVTSCPDMRVSWRSFMHSSAVGMPPGAPAAQHRADEVAPLQVMCAATRARWWMRSTANHTCTPCASWSLCACGAHGAVGVGSC